MDSDAHSSSNHDASPMRGGMNETPIYDKAARENYVCGVAGHTSGFWEDLDLEIWWCPDCGTEIWLGEESNNG